MELNDIQTLIKFVAKAGVSEVELETKDFKITIKSPAKSGKRADGETTIIQQVPMQAVQPMMPAQPAVAPPAPAPVEAPKEEAKPAAPAEDDSKYVTIKSPMIGTFYRSSSPDKPVFVSVGDEVKPGSVICILEAMKLFNEIESEISGKIVKVLVDDATPVEYDQPLFLVDPS